MFKDAPLTIPSSYHLCTRTGLDAHLDPGGLPLRRDEQRRRRHHGPNGRRLERTTRTVKALPAANPILSLTHPPIRITKQAAAAGAITTTSASSSGAAPFSLIPPERKTPDVLESVFIYAAVWAFGGCMAVDKQADYRKQFSDAFAMTFGQRFPKVRRHRVDGRWRN